METKFKNAFDSICAEDALKEATKAAVSKKIKKTEGHIKMRFPYKRILATAVCLMVLCLGWAGYNIYYTPITVISVDINPSVELGVNRFDRVISVSAFNSEADEIVSGLKVEHLNYKKAVEKLLLAEKNAGYTADEEVVYITVFDDDEKRCDRMISDINKNASGDCAVQFCKGNKKNFKEAHNNGLSAGKYEVFLALQESDPTITIEEAKALTMRQMKDRLDKSEHPNKGDGKGEHGNGADKGEGAHHGESNGNGKGEHQNDGDKGNGKCD